LKERTKELLQLFRHRSVSSGTTQPIRKSLLLLFFRKEVLPFFLFSGPCLADPTPILRAIQAHDWTNADSLAVQDPDSLAVKLVTFERLLTPGQGSAAEIADFLARTPGWPDTSLLRKRLAEALPAETDDAAVRRVCAATHPTQDTSLLRCAASEKAAGNSAIANSYARMAWTAGITSADAETKFLADWSGAIGPDAQWQRFDTLAWANDPAAGRQLARLDSDHRALGAARLAYRGGDRTADALLAAVPAALRDDPILRLEQARAARAQGDLPGALALWQSKLAALEPNAPPDRRAAFYSERDRLGRLLLAAGDPTGAYFLADDGLVGPDQAPDALFLAGWLALQRLHDAPRAAAKFKALAALSPSLITQGRAWYWLARTESDPDKAAGDFARATAYPTTFYGQQAIQHLGGALAPRIQALRDPQATPEKTAAFDKGELVRAARLLTVWGDLPLARAFVIKQAQGTADGATLALCARLAGTLGLPDAAVAVARLAGRQGVVLPGIGWPVPYHSDPASVDPALVLAVMRQESSFDAGIVSAAGAIGLMQMMPETARQIGGNPASLTDPAVNMRLGTAYLQDLLSQFGGQVAYAVAAYNAGPHRVHQWLAANGDAAAAGRDALLDWIEQIPFAETRNYVQRVLENSVVYAAILSP
jgi:soluble lytic murein transglycosylase